MKVKKTLLLALLQSAFVGGLSAQTSPAALTPSTVYVGALPTTVNPDWGCANNSPVSCWNRQLFGVEAYAGVANIWNRVGIEGQARWLHWRGVQLPTGNLAENTYVIGPTFRLYTWHSLSAGGKFLVGVGSITIPKGYGPGQGNYLVYNPSVHINQRITQALTLRYEYEYQMWPSFSGALGNHGLTPNGFGVGVTYRIHSRVY
ncbi:hypothetical protein DYQ86_02965 [Acidobacteria bacterium AB60]|nr:hypothetical protein DYQ86_02965 [Acidobacteria bacterium AB60]